MSDRKRGRVVETIGQRLGIWRQADAALKTEQLASDARPAELRRARESDMPVAPTDGRRLRATGRTEKFHTKVKPAFKAKVFALAQARGIGVAQLLEETFEELEALRVQAKVRGTGRGRRA